MIDINKKYRTRDGHEVRIYATDEGCGVASVHGAIKTKDGIWHVYSWSEDGLSIFGRERDEDLIEVCPRHKRTVWVTVYPMNRYQISDENIQCDIYPPKRIACIKVELDFEEGEGL
jgi:hypothetical protein